MKLKQSLSHIFFLLTILEMMSLSLTLTAAAPPEPNFQQFFGTVSGVEDGATVNAQIGENSFETAVVGGEYGKDAPFLVKGNSGEEIAFFLDDVQVETTTLIIGEATQLDLSLGGGSVEEGISPTEEITDETTEAMGEEEAAAPSIEEAVPEGEPGVEEAGGEATTETFTGEEAAVEEGAGAKAEKDEAGISSLTGEKTEGSNLFTYLIIIGAAFLLAVAVLLLVFWRKGKTKLQAGTGIELFYGETCRHPSHQQYPVHKHERPAEVCRAPEHQGYPLHRH